MSCEQTMPYQPDIKCGRPIDNDVGQGLMCLICARIKNIERSSRLIPYTISTAREVDRTRTDCSFFYRECHSDYVIITPAIDDDDEFSKLMEEYMRQPESKLIHNIEMKISNYLTERRRLKAIKYKIFVSIYSDFELDDLTEVPVDAVELVTIPTLSGLLTVFSSPSIEDPMLKVNLDRFLNGDSFIEIVSNLDNQGIVEWIEDVINKDRTDRRT